MLETKLYTFLKLAECGSTTRCAEQLHITQPAVSQHLKALEAEYGLCLFAREGRRLVLTPEGKIDFLKIKPLGRMGYWDYTYVNDVFSMAIPGLTAVQMAGMGGDRIKKD